MALITEVCWRMNKCRVRCSVRQLCCSGVLVATNRMFGLVTASQIASASVASFLCRFTGLHIGRRHHTYGVAKRLEFARPMMRRPDKRMTVWPLLNKVGLNREYTD